MKISQEEKEIDNFIKLKLGAAGDFKAFSRKAIRPSSDFVERIMNRANCLERNRRIGNYILAIAVSVLPIIIRELWFFIRGDYFSVSRMPFGHLLTATYQFLLSTVTLYLLVFVGAGVFILLIGKIRRSGGSLARPA